MWTGISWETNACFSLFIYSWFFAHQPILNGGTSFLHLYFLKLFKSCSITQRFFFFPCLYNISEESVSSKVSGTQTEVCIKNVVSSHFLCISMSLSYIDHVLLGLCDSQFQSFWLLKQREHSTFRKQTFVYQKKKVLLLMGYMLLHNWVTDTSFCIYPFHSGSQNILLRNACPSADFALPFWGSLQVRNICALSYPFRTHGDICIVLLV